MSDAEESYYVRWRGKVDGPYPLERIKELVAQGQLSRIHDLSTDQVVWQQADTLADLYPTYERNVPKVVHTPEPTDDDSSQPEELSLAQWYYSVNGSVDGPCATSELKQLIAAGELSSSDYVSRIESPEDWRLVMEMPELKNIERPAIAHLQESPALCETPDASANGHKFAVTSMILGLVGIISTPLGIPAIIYGGLAKRRMSRTGNRAGSGMATAGILLGIIDVILTVLWIVILYKITTDGT